jgi:hypothetical protein
MPLAWRARLQSLSKRQPQLRPLREIRLLDQRAHLGGQSTASPVKVTNVCEHRSLTSPLAG